MCYRMPGVGQQEGVQAAALDADKLGPDAPHQLRRDPEHRQGAEGENLHTISILLYAPSKSNLHIFRQK